MKPLGNILYKRNVVVRSFFLLLIWGTSNISVASKFDFNANCIKAQDAIFALKLEQAKSILNNELANKKDNLAPLFLLNYADFLELFIEEDVATYAVLKKNEEERLKKLRQTSCNSPYYYYTIAEIKLQWAFVKLKFNEYMNGALAIRDAYRLLEKNKKLYPDFELNGKSMGLIEALVGTVPEQYQWMTKLIGLSGTIRGGASKLEIYLNNSDSTQEHQYFKKETAFVLALIQHHLLKDETKAWNTILPYTNQYKNYLLEAYFRSSIAHSVGKNDEVISILNARPKGNEIQAFYYLDYLVGVSKMRRLDSDAAIYLKKYTVLFKGKNYIKSAYRYLAWLSWIEGNEQDYYTYLSLTRKKGFSDIDEDKQAHKEALEKQKMHSGLLRARLLFDGKYYEHALKELDKIPDNEPTGKWALELVYRKGRIYHETGNRKTAELWYKKTIQQGAKMPYYFACNAALNLGYLYEEQGNYNLALQYYQSVLKDFKMNTEYKNSMEQKARAGIKRLKD